MIRGKVKIDLTGIDAIESSAKSRAITLKAVKAGAKLVQSAMKANAPKDSGALKQSIGIKAVKGSKSRTGAVAVVGARKKVQKMVTRKGRTTPTKAVPAFYAHLEDQGVRPHAVGKGSKLGRKEKPNGAQTGGMHPGVKATRFMQDAWENTQSQAAEAATQVAAAEIAAAMAKQAAKGK